MNPTNSQPHTSQASAFALADLAQRFWEFRCHEEPLVAIHAGEKTVDAVLFRESPQDLERRCASAGTLLAQLEAIPQNDLTTENWATHRLLRYELEGIRAFNRVRLHERPALFPFGPNMLTAYFSDTATLTTLENAELYVERLRTIPSYLVDVMANLSRGQAAGLNYPRQVLSNASASVRASIQGEVESLAWFSPFRRTALVGEGVNRIAERARGVIAGELVRALQSYAQFIEGPLADGARNSVSCTDAPDGMELYEVLVRHFTTTDLTAPELHELGKSEISRLTAEMQTIATDSGFAGNLSDYRVFLTSDPQFVATSKEALREQIEILSKRIDLKIPVFFGRIPRTTYGVRSIPEATAALLPPAYAQPNPADGSGPGVHWVTSLPAKAPSFMHIPLALHEAWPGHLMHLALIQEMSDLPAFRRFGALRYSACLEGWALYCEGLGVEMGLYETSHQHFGRLQMELWRAIRLVVDTGIHAQGWTRDRAIDYMAAHLALSRVTIESEVDRYIGTPAQALAYCAGNLKFREVRRRAEKRLGRRFDVRAYHDQLMAAGPVTLPVLERFVDDYIQRSANAVKT